MKMRFAGMLAGAAFALAVGATSASAFVLGPTSPGKWGPGGFGTGATITYSFTATGVVLAQDSPGLFNTALADFMPGGFKTEIEKAFAAWSTVADLTFVEVADAGEPFNTLGASGDIRIGAHAFDGVGGTLAHGFFPPVNGNTAAGDIHFDLAEAWKIGFGGPGFDIFQVAAHEIGHAIGLDHTGVPSSLMHPFYTEAILGPQADDIAGACFLYGGNPGECGVPPDGVVPLPAALPLALSAFAIIGFLGHRRSARAA